MGLILFQIYHFTISCHLGSRNKKKAHTLSQIDISQNNERTEGIIQLSPQGVSLLTMISSEYSNSMKFVILSLFNLYQLNTLGGQITSLE